MIAKAELSLILSAKNLATNELNKVRDAAAEVGKRAGEAFDVAKRRFEDFKIFARGLGRAIRTEFTQGVGNLAADLARGQNPLTAFADFIAGFAAIGASAAATFVLSMGGKVVALVAGSAFVAPIIAAVQAQGAVVGAAFAAAIPAGMALLPALLAAAIAAAILFLVANPQIVDAIFKFVSSIIDNIMKFLEGLGKVFPKPFRDAFGILSNIVQKFVDGALNQIQFVADGLRSILERLGLATAASKTFGGSLGKGPYGPLNHATGGWSGLRGPELIRVGERGPEFVSRAGRESQLAAAGGGGIPGHGHDIYMDSVKVARAVDRQLEVAAFLAPSTSQKV